MADNAPKSEDRVTQARGDPALETAGESGGGPYPNPHRGKTPQDGLLGHGGQTDIDQKLHPGEAKDS